VVVSGGEGVGEVISAGGWWCREEKERGRRYQQGGGGVEGQRKGWKGYQQEDIKKGGGERGPSRQHTSTLLYFMHLPNNYFFKL
jgi:hypothetical protein